MAPISHLHRSYDAKVSVPEREGPGCLKAAGSLGRTEELKTIIAAHLEGSLDNCRVLSKLTSYVKEHELTAVQLGEQLAPWLEGDEGSSPSPQTPSPSTAAAEAQADASASSTGGASEQEQQAQHEQQQEEQGQQQQESERERVEHLLRNVEVVRFCTDTCTHDGNFKQVSSGDLQLFYRHDKDSKQHYMKARTILNEPALNIICLAREVDLVSSWNPAMAQMEDLATISKNELLVYMALWTPWPIPSPEVYVRGVGVDLLDTEGAVVIGVTGIGMPQEGVRRIEVPGRILMHADTGGFHFRPLTPDPTTGAPRTEVTVLISLDGSKLHVPDAIISFVLRVFSPLVHRTALKVLRKLFHAKSGSKLLDRLEERREELYGVLGQRLERHLARLTAAVGITQQ